MLFCTLIYMLAMLYVRRMIKVKVGIPESFKVGWYPHKITWSSHLKEAYQCKFPAFLGFLVTTTDVLINTSCNVLFLCE